MELSRGNSSELLLKQGFESLLHSKITITNMEGTNKILKTFRRDDMVSLLSEANNMGLTKDDIVDIVIQGKSLYLVYMG